MILRLGIFGSEKVKLKKKKKACKIQKIGKSKLEMNEILRSIMKKK